MWKNSFEQVKDYYNISVFCVKMGKKNIVDMTHAKKNISNLPFDKMFRKLSSKRKKSALFRGSVVIFCYFFRYTEH